MSRALKLSGCNDHGELEDIALTTFYWKGTTFDAVRDALPDMLCVLGGMNQQQINRVPDYVPYCECKTQLESEGV